MSTKAAALTTRLTSWWFLDWRNLSHGGTVLSVTTLLPAWRRLKRRGREFNHVAMRWRARPSPPVLGSTTMRMIDRSALERADRDR